MIDRLVVFRKKEIAYVFDAFVERADIVVERRFLIVVDDAPRACEITQAGNAVAEQGKDLGLYLFDSEVARLIRQTVRKAWKYTHRGLFVSSAFLRIYPRSCHNEEYTMLSVCRYG